ncbi:MAG: caspase family protein [Clostridiales bacterium]|jgi:hypothetical protein|nr:caspase family protein [Clostridiales bacterium]
MRKALVVGIDNYGGNHNLNSCVNDANEVARLLARHENNELNFDVKLETNIHGVPALRENVKRCFETECETALFYFSGHGAINEFGGELILADYLKDQIGFSMNDIIAVISTSKAQNKVVILDCCHSGYAGSMPTSGTTATIENGVTILTASKSNETALSGNPYSLFTSLLVEALRGGAADIMGHITLGGIYSYIDKSLGSWGQRPLFKTNVSSFMSIREVAPPIDPNIIRALPIYFKNYYDILALDPSFEPTNTESFEHEVLPPFADEKNVKVFDDLQMLESVGLVVPHDEKHMYYAAMKSKGCKLTLLGQHYWNLVKNNKI